jgi:DNA-binding XRE family transcriptional regulator
MAAGSHRQARPGSPECPHGQGFVAQIPLRFTIAKPKPHYPKQIKNLGDHIKVKRLDRDLFQKQVAGLIGVDTTTITNWELGNTEPEKRFIPAIITFLGYNPLPPARPLASKAVVLG